MRAAALRAGAIVLGMACIAGVAMAEDVEHRAIFVHGAGHGGENVFFHGGDEGFDLAELLDGETRTFGSGEHQVTATRAGDLVTIERPGDDDARIELTCNLTTDSCRVIEGGEGGRTMLWIQKERSCESADEDCDVVVLEALGEGVHDAHANVVVRREIDCEGDDCPAMEVLVKHFSGDHAAMEGHANVFIADGEAPVHWIEASGADQRTLRCPEGDTTMRVKKDEVDEVFLCPKHSKPLEEVKVRTRVMPGRVEIREANPHEH